MLLIDAHAHLDKYGNSLAAAIAEIEEKRVFTFATAMDPPSYMETLKIAEQSDLILPTFGVHPRRAPLYVDRLGELGSYIERSPAIGEIGLDFHWIEDTAQYPAQRKVLEYFFAAARDQKKVVNLHTKGAEKEILDLLEDYDLRRAIVHWYSGPSDVFRAMAEFGVYFTIGVEALFSDRIKEIARNVPDRLLLTETDNPGGLQWLKGEPGMPGVLEEVIQAIADVRQASRARITNTVMDNFSRLIASDPWFEQVRQKWNRWKS